MNEFLNSPMSKDKSVKVKRYENKRFDTSAETYKFSIKEWVDRTDSPETLKLHSKLPFLGLTIKKKATISK